MNPNLAMAFGKRFVTGTVVPTSTRLMVAGAMLFVASVLAIAQNSAVQEKLASVKQSIAANQQKLHQYQWTETTQLTLKGDPKPPSQSNVPVRP